MKTDIRSLVPPGLSYKRERNTMLRVLAVMTLLSVLIFLLSRYLPARRELFDHIRIGGKLVSTLIPGAQIQDFPQVMNRVLDPMLIAMLLAPVQVLLHYLYYRRGSMSIYLMRRLPDRGLLHRQCWTLPLLGLALTITITLILLGIYLLIYIYATPAACLPLAYRRFRI